MNFCFVLASEILLKRENNLLYIVSKTYRNQNTTLLKKQQTENIGTRYNTIHNIKREFPTISACM